MIGKFEAIIITADEPYQGMSHTQVLYANYLSQFVPVLYIQAPKQWRPWNILSAFSNPVKQTETLSVLSYTNALPASLKGALRINESINAQQVKKWLRQGAYKNVLIWHFDSYRSVLHAKSITKNFSVNHVYHVIDPYYKNPVDPILRELAKVVVVTSPRNNTFYENVTNKLINIPQCIDVAKEQSYLVAAPEQVVNEKDYLVLLGTISDDSAIHLLHKLAEAGHKLVIIGKLIPMKSKKKDFDQLLQKSNVEYLGFLPPQKFYPILQGAKAGIIAYDLSVRYRNFSPLKAINYLIAGLPVISNCDTELPALKNKAVFEVSGDEDFLRICSSSDAITNFQTDTVDRYLQEISLENAVKQIVKML